MASSRIDIIVEATTAQASRNLRSLTGDVDDLGDEVERTNKRMASLKKGFAIGLGVAAAGAAASVAAVGAVMVSSVRAGADAQEMLSKFNVVFADTAGTAEKVTAEMDAFAKQSGRNKYMLREMASGFGDVLKPLGFSVEEAGGLSTQMTQLAVDLGSFNNMKPEEAFERLSSTLIGNHANALSFGVVINESILKEELMAMGADELTGSLLEQAKVQARINILMRGTTDAQGDAIRTSDSWTNQMLRLNSVIDETKTTIGLKLLPVLTPFLEMLGTLASEYAPKAVEALAGLIDSIDVEALEMKLDEFMAGLMEGDLIIGPFSITFDTPSAEEWQSWLNPPDKQFNISLEDYFSFDVQKWLDEKMKVTEFKIGPKLLGWESEWTFETVTIDGVIVGKKATLGELFQGEWREDGGLVTLVVGGVDLAKTQMSWADLLEGASEAWAAELDSAAKDISENLGKTVGGAVWSSLVTFSTTDPLELFNLNIPEGFGSSVGESIWSGLVSFSETDPLELFSFAMPEWWGAQPAWATVQPEWILTQPEWWSAQPEWITLQPEWVMNAPEWVGTIFRTAPTWWDLSVPDWWTFQGLKSPEFWTFLGMQKPTFWTFMGLSRPTWWKLSNLEAPKWVSDLLGWLGGGSGGADSGGGGGGADSGGGGGGLATGTSFFPGGRTWVGETGPELVTLPRGAMISPAGYASQVAAAGAGVTINVNATVNNEMDAHILARRVVDIIQRRGM